MEVGSFVRNFHAIIPFDDAKEWSPCYYGSHHLVTVAHFLPQLCSFHLTAHDMLSSILLSVLHISGTTLTSLRMMVSHRDEYCIALIHKFENLVDLSLTLSWRRPPVLDVKPLCLPNIQKVSFHWPDSVPHKAHMFLGRCHFLGASEVSLSAPAITEDCLMAFLCCGVKALARLRLRVPRALISSAGVVTALSKRTRYIDFADCVPDLAFVDAWILPIHQEIQVGSSSDGSQLWPFLQHLLRTCAQAGAGSLIVHVRIEGSRFTWRCGTGSDAKALFVGKLVSFALQLEERRVYIQDEEGVSLRQTQ
jgi:hypothetical protein